MNKIKTMTDINKAEFAIVRNIPNSFPQCITAFSGKSPIDVILAQQQHELYCKTLVELGLKLVRIEADNSLPDCCFTEDAAIVTDVLGIISLPGTESRHAEIIEMEKALTSFKKIRHIAAPATIEGGDVLKIGKKLFIGNSARTNDEGIKQVANMVSELGYEVIPVKIRNTLHLKTVCTYLGNNCIIYADGHFDENIFAEYDKIIVPATESYCANTLVVNGKVLIPKGFPLTRSLIEKKGFSVIELDMSEIEKADGALTCLSVIF
jgi:dimethylargininase